MYPNMIGVLFMNFSESKTKINLMKAFAGECQASERYSMASSFASKEGFYVIQQMFLTISNQEKEHGEIFYGFLKSFSGENIQIDADYPIDIFDSTLGFLEKASKNEMEEFDSIYREFGNIAYSEGFEDISKKFFEIANIEKIHSQKFSKIVLLLKNDELFNSRDNSRWTCLKCGNVYDGTQIPKICPVCGHEQGYYLRDDLFWYIF